VLGIVFGAFIEPDDPQAEMMKNKPTHLFVTIQPFGDE